MFPTISGLRRRARSPGAQKAIRYSLVSAISVVVNQVGLFVLFTVLGWTARSANILACALGGIPSYHLNRRWTWGKTGRSHLIKEVAPFWTLAFLGLIFSTWAADFGESQAQDLTSSRVVQGLIVNGASLAAFGVLWVAKFVLFNKVLFVTRDEDLQAELADEVVA